MAWPPAPLPIAPYFLANSPHLMLPGLLFRQANVPPYRRNTPLLDSANVKFLSKNITFENFTGIYYVLPSVCFEFLFIIEDRLFTFDISFGLLDSIHQFFFLSIS